MIHLQGKPDENFWEAPTRYRATGGGQGVASLAATLSPPGPRLSSASLLCCWLTLDTLHPPCLSKTKRPIGF